MDDLTYSLKQLCQHNRDGSFNTQADRQRMLKQFAAQLINLGFRKMTATSLKAKHVYRLLEQWQSENKSAATIKN